MSQLSDQLVATAEQKLTSAQAAVEKLEAQLEGARVELVACERELKTVEAAPEIPDAEHLGHYTVIKA